MLLLEDAEFAISDQLQVMQDRKPILRENKVVLPSGRVLYYLRHIMPLPGADDQPISQVLVLTTDLTEKHISQQRKRELLAAHEKNVFLTDFFGTVSHDLKTPLTTMNTSLYLLERAETAQQRNERITRIREQIALMDQYIQDMLTISRLEHLPTFNLEILHINPLVEEIADSLRPRLERKQILYKFNAQPDLPPIRGDHDQLRRMFTNLIENAINYTPGGGQVSVRTHANNGHVVLEIIDNGIGIEQDAVPHIFDRFYRTANAKETDRSGTGLGLAIVQKIAQMHTATIEVQSRLGEGTTFSIQFPNESLS